MGEGCGRKLKVFMFLALLKNQIPLLPPKLGNFRGKHKLSLPSLSIPSPYLSFHPLPFPLQFASCHRNKTPTLFYLNFNLCFTSILQQWKRAGGRDLQIIQHNRSIWQKLVIIHSCHSVSTLLAFDNIRKLKQQIS